MSSNRSTVTIESNGAQREELRPEEMSIEQLKEAARDHIKLITYMKEDPDHDRIIFRRFTRLNLFNILTLQRQLAEYDSQVRVEGFHACLEGAVEVDPIRCPTEMLVSMSPKIEELLERYNKALFAYKQVLEMPPTSHTVLKTLKDKADSFEPLRNEYHTEACWDDTMALVDREKGLIHKFIDKFINKSLGLGRLFKHRRSWGPSDSSDPRFFIYSEAKVRRAEHIIVDFIICCLLVAPIILLSRLNSQTAKLVVVSVCLPLAAVASPVLAAKSTHTNLAVLAGYAAILVAFITNGKLQNA
ncbi:uncharacterized protein Z518_06129 [Rhinocladiella mackenziei CBS 650.93]|uniref:DUF6594 domain-containing protein n=1 Tax=Rhinocladiella mackenziei CBS 650.93 TaxID=1442369 RepID=A0A0D2FT11_9EURO|nr:uncharacterized protein Z518_06129 [Rhinocladiella mackenziei CBS 650.93]KIX05257.1 hypothetical protein Z518_06129 [Rhinocladiella mackenziei CBS 650.93]